MSRHRARAFASVYVCLAFGFSAVVLGQSSTTPAEPPAALTATELFAKASPAVVRVICGEASGSGFFISPRGIVITNHHVIEGAGHISVVLPSNARLDVKKVLLRDRVADLAVLDTGAEDVPFLSLASRNPETGDRVYAIGNPLGLKNTLSEGLVSGIREDHGVSYVQTTAAISSGSSGGPLLISTGQVVGVTTFTYQRSQNLNFAVLWLHVKKALTDAESAVTPTTATSQPAGANPVLLVEDYESYVDRTSKLITRLERIDSDLEVGVSYAEFHNAISDANFMARKWRESLSGAEQKLYSARLIEFAVGQLKGADAFWGLALKSSYSVESICERLQQECWAYASVSVGLAEKALKTREGLQFPIACKACDGKGRRLCAWCGGTGKSFGDKCDRCSGKGKEECFLCEHGLIDLSKEKKKARPRRDEPAAQAADKKASSNEEQGMLQEQVRQARARVDELTAQLQKLEKESAKIVEHVRLQDEILLYGSYPQFADKTRAAKERLSELGPIAPADVEAYKKKREAILQSLEGARRDLQRLLNPNP